MHRLTNKCTKLCASLFTRWLAHVSAKQCHPQGAARFLSEFLERQYGRRQFMGRMVQAYVPACYAASCDGTLLTLFHYYIFVIAFRQSLCT
jgi:hypothetical protein